MCTVLEKLVQFMHLANQIEPVLCTAAAVCMQLAAVEERSS